jgi:hypothetical protein
MISNFKAPDLTAPRYREKAVRQFKRSVAKTYPKQWSKYIVMESKKRVADMYKK